MSSSWASNGEKATIQIDRQNDDSNSTVESHNRLEHNEQTCETANLRQMHSIGTSSDNFSIDPHAFSSHLLRNEIPSLYPDPPICCPENLIDGHPSNFQQYQTPVHYQIGNGFRQYAVDETNRFGNSNNLSRTSNSPTNFLYESNEHHSWTQPDVHRYLTYPMSMLPGIGEINILHGSVNEPNAFWANGNSPNIFFHYMGKKRDFPLVSSPAFFSRSFEVLLVRCSTISESGFIFLKMSS